jgi:hypothetical protein
MTSLRLTGSLVHSGVETGALRRAQGKRDSLGAVVGCIAKHKVEAETVRIAIAIGHRNIGVSSISTANVIAAMVHASGKRVSSRGRRAFDRRHICKSAYCHQPTARGSTAATAHTHTHTIVQAI